MSRIPLTLSHVYAMGDRPESRRRAAHRQRPTTLTPPGEAVAGSGSTSTFPVDSANERDVLSGNWLEKVSLSEPSLRGGCPLPLVRRRGPQKDAALQDLPPTRTTDRGRRTGDQSPQP